jgi:excinuclease ABC subunit C
LDKKIKKIIENIPKLPGIYIMKDSKSEILYIGKAKILRNRVYSYFQNSRTLHPRTKMFVDKVRDIKFLTTETEAEALILESNFVKKHQPRYNILLKDDKHYPYLRLTTQEKFPRLEVVRRVRKDKAMYFGPYTMVKEVRETIRLIYKVFPLRQSKDKLDGKPIRRPCLNHQMGRCLAPCAGNVSSEEYRAVVKDVELFLKGKNVSLLKKLKAGMESSASELRFEEAAGFRDKMQAVQTVLDKQKIISTSLQDQDVIAYCSEKDQAIAQVLIIRDGKMLSEKIFKLQSLNEMEKNETLSSFLKQYYAKEVVLPAEILLPHSVEDSALIANWLSGKKGSQVRLEVPAIGKKRDLVKMAEENASFAMRMESNKGDVGIRSLEELQATLGLNHFPEVIEGFDLSNISGSYAVGSMVAFVRGLADKSKYRRYKITTVKGVDDYAMLREVMTRRYRRLLEENCPLPNLVLIDGGRGHLSSGRKVLEALGLIDQVDLACIAKGNDRKNLDTDEVFLAHKKEPVLFSENSPSRFLMQRIRDEAHRFAISYHRRLRAKKTMRSPLENIPGIGKKRRLQLLKRFGSLENIRNASVEELKTLPGITHSIAEKLRYNDTGSN